MNRFCFTLIAALFLLSFQLGAQANERLSQRLTAANVICEGTVTDIQAHWNSTHTMIYSVYQVKVDASLVGTSAQTLSFSCAGGKVGNDLIVSSIAPDIKTGEQAVLFFHTTRVGLEILPGSWGAIHIPDDGGVCNDGDFSYNSVQDLQMQLEQVSGHNWSNSFQTSAARIIQQTSSMQISSFSPISISAGTSSVLSIHGNGFGSARGVGKVLFTNADLAGLVRNVQPYPSQYLLWSDTLIQVEVPSLSFVGSGTAGTGLIEVVNNSTLSAISSSNLTVPYALVNIDASGTPVRPDLVNDNGSGGYTITLSDSLTQNTVARQSFFYALERWRCSTLANFTPNYSSSSAATIGADGLNVVRFDSMSTYILGVTYSIYASCSGVWRLKEFDMDFNNQINWNYSSAAPTSLQQDFQSCCMNIIGFALLLDNVIDIYDVMYSDPQPGTMRRNTNANNVAGETDVLNLSALPNTCGPPPHQLVTNCAVGAPDDASISQITWPFNGFCQGTFPVKVSLHNYGVSPLSSTVIAWKLDGILQSPFSWTGSLVHDDSLSVTIASTAFVTGNHNIQAWTALPNGNTDGFADNDTAYYAFTIGTCITANCAPTSFSSPPNSACLGNLPVTFAIYNYGPTALNYAEVHWKVNGITQPTYIWTGNVPATSNSPAVTIGSYNFTQASNAIKIWTANPNGVTDSNTANDTLNNTYTPVGLNGVYTVGGISPDYATLALAISALNGFGMCGPVTFNIRPGTYTGGLTINPITTAQRTLLIQAENGDSSSVIINCSSGNNFTLNGSDYVTFRELTFQTSSTSASSQILITSDANRVHVENCVLTMPILSSTAQNVVGISETGTATNDSLVVANCLIVGGSRGFQLSSSNQLPIYGTVISGCTVQQQYDNCLEANYCSDLLLLQNTFSSTAPNCGGIWLRHCNGSYKVIGNKMYTAYFDVYVENSDSPLATKALFANNFLVSSASRCVTLTYSTSINFTNNTMRATAYELFYYSAGSSTVPHLVVLNNIICNMMPVASYIYNISFFSASLSSPFDTLCNNAYYQGGDAFGLINNQGTAFDLTQWRGIAQADSNSFTVNPQFVSTTDLHIVPTYASVQLKRGGLAVSYNTTDIDGQTRNASRVDIGADEFAQVALDAATSNIQPAVRSCPGINPVTVRLSNFGTTTLTSAVINWKVNNVTQTPYNWNGTLASMGSVNAVTIGNYNFGASTYTVQIWVSQPNAGNDAVHANDTSLVTLAGTGMSGIYTIGGISPNYATVALAASALTANGVCGPTTFRIRAGTYSSATLQNVNGVSSINTITFLSDNGDSSLVTAGFTVVGNGYYHLYQLTLSTLQMNGAKHLHVNNCIITGTATTTANTVNEDVEIDHCGFATALSMTGYSLHNGSFWVYYKNKNISIHHNNFVLGGIVLSNMVGTKVYNNTMLQTAQLSVMDAFDTLVVSHNIVNANGTDGMDIELKFAAPGAEEVIDNNMVSVLGSSVNYGMTINTNHAINIFNNSVRFAGNSNGWACFIHWPAATSPFVQVINNNFANIAGGYAIAFAYAGNLHSDYNNLYSTGTYTILAPQPLTNLNSLSQWQSLFGQDLHSVSVQPQFVSASDLHANNDVFLLDAGTPLPTITTDVDNQSRSITAPDIGADEFSYVPISANDAGVQHFYLPSQLCQGVAPITVNVRNYGNAPLTTVTVNWSVNGILQTPYTWNGNITTLDSTGSIVIANYNFMAPDTYKIKLWTSQPNSAVDGYAPNDTCIRNWITPQLSGTYTVGGVAPDFLTLGQAELVLDARGICGPVIFNIRSGYQLWGGNLIPFSGASAVNTVTYQAENGDSTSVTVSQVSLGNMQWLRFHQLTISTMTAGNNSSQIEFTNCVFNSTLNELNYVNNYFLFENNLFSGSVNWSGTSAGPEWGNVFRNNTFVSCSKLLVNYQYDVLVYGNTFDCPTSISSPALSLVACRDSSQATHNYISGNYSAGIYMSAALGINTPLLIANNMITGGSNMTDGIACTNNSQSIHVYNNNVYSVIGSCLNSQNSHVVMRNNIFYNTATANGYAYMAGSATAITSSDYNDLFSAGPTIVRWQSTNCNSIAQLQTVSGGMEMNSINVNPLYVSASDLHILNSALDSAGLTLPEISDDFDFDPRQNPPDIGADERGFFPNDIGIIALVQPIPACEGVDAVSVTLKNFGTMNLSSCVIQWKMNGVLQTAVNWSGNLLTGASTTVLLGNYTFSHATPVQMQTWTEQPNGFVDGFASNDTLATLTIMPRMSGTFTLGGVTPDYPNFTAAASDLMNFGVCGPVVFNVRNGTYNEQITIGNVMGASPVNNVVFQSEVRDSSLVTLAFSGGQSNNYTIKLMDCNDITFRNMTLQALNVNYGKVVVATGNLQRINFRNNVVVGSTNNPSLPYDHTLFDVSMDQQAADFYVDRSVIKWGGVGILTSGPGLLYTDTAMFVTDNIFTDQFIGCVEFSHQSYTFIKGNTVTTQTTSSTFKAINSYLQNRYAYIAYNNIYGFAGTGIMLTDIDFCSVYNNTISVKQNAQSIYVYNAVFAQSTMHSSFYNNSFAVWGTRRGAATVDLGGFLAASYTDTLKNNIIANMGDGGYAIYFNDQSMNISNVMDHNLYYTCGDTLIYSTYTFGNTAYADLPTWQAATGRDMNSVEAIPQYITQNDLHILSNSFADNRGIPLPQIPIDKDGQVRNPNTPDIGAYEYSSLLNDAAAVSMEASTIACNGGNVNVVIGNFGTNAITAVEIHWSVNAVQQPVYYWTGNLAPASFSPSITLGSYLFSTTDVIKAWTELPNGVADAYPQTDTSTCNEIVTVTPPSLGPDVNFCSGSSANLFAGIYSSYLWSDGSTSPSLFVNASGTYWITVSTPGGCIMSDTIVVNVLALPMTPTITQNGNVLQSSSATGNQWYLNGNPIAGATGQTYTTLVGGNYTVEVTGANGCTASSAIVVVVGIQENASAEGEMWVYPNPSTGNFQITFDVLPDDGTILFNLFDGTGRLIWHSLSNPMVGTKSVLSVNENLPAGIYLLEMKSQGRKFTKKIIIEK